MEIAFSTKALRSLAESRSLATRKLGTDVALALHAQLADLDAAETPEELPLGFSVSHSSPIQLVLPLADDYVAVFQSNHRRDREAEPGTKVQWSRVRRVKLVEVVMKK